MPQKIKPIILLSIIFLSSCVFLTENTLNQTINDENFLNRFPQNQKAILIFKLIGKKNERLYLCPKETIINNLIKNCQAVYATNQYHILMLKPNLYYLFAPPQNLPLFSSNQISKQEKYLTILELKAGEIIYAGDISYRQIINDDKEKTEKMLDKKFAISDNFELVENVLSGKNSKQKEKLFSNQSWEIDYLISKYLIIKERFKKRLFNSFEFKNPNLENKEITQNA